MNDFYEDLFKEIANESIAKRDYDKFFDETGPIYSGDFNSDCSDYLVIPRDALPRNVKRISFDINGNIIFSREEFNKKGLLAITEYSKETERTCGKGSIVGFAKHLYPMDLHIKRTSEDVPSSQFPGPNIAFRYTLSAGRNLGPKVYTVDGVHGERLFLFNSIKLS